MNLTVLIGDHPMGWIRREQEGFKEQDRQSPREMVTGESHYFQGRRYRLNVIEQKGLPAVEIPTNTTMEKWETRVGVRVAEIRIKRMKTRWGTCNSEARRIWLNLELVKKPVCCLEYILVHEMIHLLERHHNDRFRDLMDATLPQWRLYREELNCTPLAHEEWLY
ncbi:MAG: SprT-like domain-containing protein [Pseudohongiellaceae bacterium]